MKWGIDLKRFDKEISGRTQLIFFGGLLIPAFFALLGGSMIVQNWRNAEGIEMFGCSALALAVQIGLIAAGYGRQLAWALGIGWGAFLAIGVLVEYGPRIAREVLSCI